MYFSTCTQWFLGMVLLFVQCAVYTCDYNVDLTNARVICWCVVGNKNDDPENKVVLTEDAQQFADQMGIELFETSAKENINVEEVGLVFSFW